MQFLALAVAACVSRIHETNSPDHQSITSLGRSLYQVHCESCHGGDGRGDGPVARFLYPRPRDLTGPFRLRSTTEGQPPTDEDVLAVIERGIAGAPMPGLPGLTRPERAALLAYLKQLSPALARGGGTPVVVGREPAPTAAAREAGRAIYTRLDCASCHGVDGRGDGDLADSLTDDHGLAIRPRDLTREAYKGGATARDIYVRLATGMDGSPMAAVTDQSATPAERWQLAQYVASLAAGPGPAPGVAPGVASVLRSRRVEVRPDDPLAATWASAEAVSVAVFPLRSRPGRAPPLAVRSLHDDRGIAIRIDWPDDTRSDGGGPSEFSDAAAVQLVYGARPSFIGMGTPDSPVAIWHWKADWQRQLEPRGGAALPDADYPFPIRSAVQADNPHAAEHRRTPVEEGAARGAGTFTARAAEPGGASGRGVWSHGRWYVVLTRAFAGAARPERVAFAVWDGAARDRGGQKLVSGWYALVLQTSRGTHD